MPIFFKRKVSSVEQMKLEILQITLVGMGTFGREDMIILSSDN